MLYIVPVPHCWILRSQVLSLWLRGESPQSVGAPLGHLSWQKGTPIQTPAVQTNVYQGPVWQHAYGRFVGRCKAMGALELFVHFQTTEAGGHIICVHSKHPSDLVSGSPWSYLLPWSRPWRIPPEWQMSMQMFWDEYKEKAHVFYFEFLAESMSNMHSLIHAHLIAFFCGGGSQPRKLLHGDRGLSEKSPGFWTIDVGNTTHVCQQWPQIENEWSPRGCHWKHHVKRTKIRFWGPTCWKFKIWCQIQAATSGANWRNRAQISAIGRKFKKRPFWYHRRGWFEHFLNVTLCWWADG